MDVALCQRAADVGAVKPNLATVLEDLDRVGPANDLVLFPELFLSGYSAGDQHHELALDTDGGPIREIAERAREHSTAVVVGGPRAGEVRGTTHNSAFLATPEGDVHAYDKVHLPTFNVFEEGLTFTPGTRGLLVELDEATVGVAICYDLFFPEVTKDLALRGADVIATISASPTTSHPYFETVLPARALETTSFVLYCNLTGREGSVTFAGGSRAYSPLGETLLEARTQEEVIAEIALDLDHVALSRRKRPTLRDTRAFPWGSAEDEDGVPWPTSREELDD